MAEKTTRSRVRRGWLRGALLKQGQTRVQNKAWAWNGRGSRAPSSASDSGAGTTPPPGPLACPTCGGTAYTPASAASSAPAAANVSDAARRSRKSTNSTALSKVPCWNARSTISPESRVWSTWSFRIARSDRTSCGRGKRGRGARRARRQVRGSGAALCAAGEMVMRLCHVKRNFEGGFFSRMRTSPWRPQAASAGRMWWESVSHWMCFASRVDHTCEHTRASVSRCTLGIQHKHVRRGCVAERPVVCPRASKAAEPAQRREYTATSASSSGAL